MSNAISPVREQLRNEIMAALAGGASLTTSGIYAMCPSASDPEDVSRVAYEMRKKGLIVSDKIPHPRGQPVNSYRLANTPQPQPEPIIMSEEPMPYDTNPDAFTMEPSEPEAEHDIDDELTSLLSEVAALKPTDDAMMQAGEYVGDLTDAMARRREELTRKGVLTDANVDEIVASISKNHEWEAKKVCQCLRINSLPPLPKGYIYGGIKVWIESEHDVGRLTIATHDDGGGAFASIKASGRLSFDPGDLVAIGQVADALIKLHESMDKQNID